MARVPKPRRRWNPIFMQGFINELKRHAMTCPDCYGSRRMGLLGRFKKPCTTCNSSHEVIEKLEAGLARRRGVKRG